ncbi:Bestrophin, RFP-TM, chloride channel-domain-containing protein [Mortierella sp. GBAus27b]|nr:hypothetical protein BGX31_006900 [Mortierella sp. GBA43]KAI8352297.1 Bestrophin, RFP-TM, chloride channel-domain-containing protein [Mortierella sp. GBAus27b]
MSYFKFPAEYYRRARWAYPDSLRWRGSVLPAVISDVIIVTTFSAAIIFIEKSQIIDHTLNVPNMIVPALSVVVGLILAFRTNTAYDRFWEGRKLWSSLDVQIRNFSRSLWVGMKELPPSDTGRGKGFRLRGHHLFGRSTESLKAKANGTDSAEGSSTSSASQTIRTGKQSNTSLIDIDNNTIADPHDDIHDKVLVIRLLLAFAVATKHHLRQEFKTDYHDLQKLLPDGYVPCAARMGHIGAKPPVHDKAMGDRHILRQSDEDAWTISADNEEGAMSLPLEIAHGLALWVLAESRAGMIENGVVGNLLSSINAMTDVFTNMERIVFTPIPLAYSIHLRQVVYLYCLALPFTFIDALSWLLIPMMMLISFTLFGMECIGREIENPFGNDANDLHMDEYCRDLKRELEYLVTLKNNIPGVAQ